MPLTPDQERWAEALQIEKMYGPKAAAFIAERIATLGRAGDAAGETRFRAIAWRHELLGTGAQS